MGETQAKIQKAFREKKGPLKVKIPREIRLSLRKGTISILQRYSQYNPEPGGKEYVVVGRNKINIKQVTTENPIQQQEQNV